MKSRLSLLIAFGVIAFCIAGFYFCASDSPSDANKNTNSSTEKDANKSDGGDALEDDPKSIRDGSDKDDDAVKDSAKSPGEGSDRDDDDEELVTSNSVASAEADEIVKNILNDNKSEFAKHLPEDFTIPTDFLGKRILVDYGAMLLAKGVEVPRKLVFDNEEEVQEWQKGKGITHTFTTGQIKCKKSGIKVTLQKEPLEALIKVTKESKTQAMPRCSFAVDKLDFSKINSTDFADVCKSHSDDNCSFDSTKRTFTQTIVNWVDRVNDTLAKRPYNSKEKIETLGEEGKITEHIDSIFALESQKDGKCFNSNEESPASILYSAAPPGASQHHSMIAVDLYRDWRKGQHSKIKRWMAQQGWYETVYRDTFHFTYLGVKIDKSIDAPDFDIEVRERLEKLGLKLIDGYWLPRGWKEFKC